MPDGRRGTTPASSDFLLDTTPHHAAASPLNAGSPSGAIHRVRSEVDGVYQELAGRLFTSLERLAASDPKYGDRLRLENYG